MEAALRISKPTPHITVVTNALTSADGELCNSVCNEFDKSNVQRVTNIFNAIYECRFGELYGFATDSGFQNTQLSQFTEFAQEVVNQRPLPFGSKVWCTYGFCSMADASQECAECQLVAVENVQLREERFGTEVKLIVVNTTNENDFAIISNMTLEQAKNKLMRELHLVQNAQPEALKPALTDKKSFEADMYQLCISKGYRSGGDAYYHLIDIFDVFEANKDMDLSDVKNIPLGDEQAEIISFKDEILEWSNDLIQKANGEQNPNLDLYRNFGTFVSALMKKTV